MNRARVLFVVVAILGVAATALSTAYGPIGAWFETLVAKWQHAITRSLSNPDALAGWRLYAVAFLGGLAASLSPCILGMLPVNLSYIGAAKLASHRAAIITAISGVIVVNTAFGLLSSLFFAVLVDYRSMMNIVVGLLAVFMGLWMMGIIRLSVPNVVTIIPTGFGPFVVGIVFALIASPCASPILVTVLGIASQDGVPLRAVTAMVVYSIGYTIVLFTASLFAGVATSSRKLLAYGDLITRIGAVSLVAIGLATAWYGFSLR